LVSINSRSLPEQTASDLEIKYVDIGAVGRGALVSEPEVTTFGNDEMSVRVGRVALSGKHTAQP
jgi:hypothetical protein